MRTTNSIVGSRRIVSGYGVARSRAAVVTVVTVTTGRMRPSVAATPGRGPVVTPRVGRLRSRYVVVLVTRARRLVRGGCDSGIDESRLGG